MNCEVQVFALHKKRDDVIDVESPVAKEGKGSGKLGQK
jgi:hypothetical protein